MSKVSTVNRAISNYFLLILNSIFNNNKKQFMEKKKNIILTVMAPIPKANTSVNDVTVMATPACFIVKPIFSCKVFPKVSSSCKLYQHWTMTNMSSIPIPGKKLKDKHYYSKKNFFFFWFTSRVTDLKWPNCQKHWF